jgi:hypothetical protein
VTARSIGELLAGLEPAKRARTFQPVRRDSYYRGDREELLWRPIGKDKRSAKRLIGARLKAAERYEHHHRRELQRRHPGRRNGPLGDVGLMVLKALYDLVDFKTGRLDPAIDTIAARICKARSAVIRALSRLREHGFINWIRRSEPVDNDGAGPQVRQISNAYGFGMPAEAAAWVDKWQGKSPLPDDELVRLDMQQAELAAMLSQASLVEVVDYRTDDPLLAGILKKMASSPFLK